MKNFFKEIILPYLALCVFVLCAFAVNCKGSPVETRFYFAGAYKLTEILPSLCTNCRLDVPAEFSDLEIFLSVSSQDKKDLQKSVKSALSGMGYNAIITDKLIKIEKKEIRLVPYVSCLDTNLYEIPENTYKLRRYSDSLKCDSRISSLKETQIIKDSLLSVPALPYLSYKLRYVTLYKKFADRMGVDWSEILASGSLRTYPKIYDKWAIVANETNDTTFSIREISFSFDSSFALNWGSEKQIETSTTIQDGFLTSEKEWRKYGVQINLTATDSRIKMDYTFRNDDETSLNGGVGGSKNDTLKVYGDYTNKVLNSSGVPIISRIPFIGNLFKVESVVKEIARFELYLIPIQNSSK